MPFIDLFGAPSDQLRHSPGSHSERPGNPALIYRGQCWGGVFSMKLSSQCACFIIKISEFSLPICDIVRLVRCYIFETV